MSSCAVCHAGFSRFSNPQRHCKKCLRTVCRECSQYIPVASIPPTVTEIPRTAKKTIRMCRQCVMELRQSGGTRPPAGSTDSVELLNQRRNSDVTVASDVTQTTASVASSSPPLSATAAAAGTGLQGTQMYVSMRDPDPIKRRRTAVITRGLQVPWWMLLAMPFAHNAVKHQRLGDKAIGYIYVRVIEADGLLAFGRDGLRRHPTSQPFAEVAVGQHVISMQTTRTISATISPVWDEAFLFTIQSPYAIVRVTLWHSLGGERKHPLGEILLPIHLFSDQRAHDMWCFLRPCGAAPGERGIKQIVSAVDARTGGNIGAAIEGVRAKRAIVPPSTFAALRPAAEATAPVQVWKLGEQSVTQPNAADEPMFSRVTKRLRHSWNVLRGRDAGEQIVNTSIINLEQNKLHTYEVQVTERTTELISPQDERSTVQKVVDRITSVGRSTSEQTNTPTHPPVFTRGTSTPTGGVHVDTHLQKPVEAEKKSDVKKERRHREHVQAKEAVYNPSQRTSAELTTEPAPTHHRRRSSLMGSIRNLPNLGDLFADTEQPAHVRRPSHVQHKIEVDQAAGEVSRDSSSDAINEPPVQTSGAVVHDYGLGRIHIQVQMRYDTTAEFWSHLTNFERPPPQSHASFAVAVMVHQWMRIYNMISKPLSWFGRKLSDVITWKDAVGSMITIFLMTLSLHFPSIIPVLLHILLLRYLLVARLRRELRDKADAVRQPIQTPDNLPTIVSAATVMEKPGGAVGNPLAVADVLPQVLAAEEAQGVHSPMPSLNAHTSHFESAAPLTPPHLGTA